MRYSKPNVLASVNANVAIQQMLHGGDNKSNPVISDNTQGDVFKSTTGAYDAEA